MMRLRFALPLVALVVSCATTSGRSPGGEPADGTALLARMQFWVEKDRLIVT
jgi:hypothetical protein